MKAVISAVIAVLLVATCDASALGDRQQFSPEEFVYNIANSPAIQTQDGGIIKPASSDFFPTVQEMMMAIFVIPPCSLNAFHTHPRGEEVIYVTQGEKLIVGFAEENGGRFITNTIEKGHFAVFPRGLLHFQYNDSCEPVKFVAFLSDRDGGVQSYPAAMFGFDEDAVLQSAFGINQKNLGILRKSFAERGPRASCLKACGL